MARKLVLLASLCGVALFWSALAAEILLRALPNNYIALTTLVFVSCLMAGATVNAVINRNIPTKSSSISINDSKQPKQGRSTPIPTAKKPTQRTNERTGTQSRSQSKTTPRPRPMGDSVRQSARVDGRIMWYSPKSSYGFIELKDGTQAFFHKNNLDPETQERSLVKEHAVTFVIQEGTRGPVANNVRLAA